LHKQDFEAIFLGHGRTQSPKILNIIDMIFPISLLLVAELAWSSKSEPLVAVV